MCVYVILEAVDEKNGKKKAVMDTNVLIVLKK